MHNLKDEVAAKIWKNGNSVKKASLGCYFIFTAWRKHCEIL